MYLTNRNNDELKVEFHGAQDAAMVLLRNEDDCYLGWKLDGAQDVQPKVVDFARPQESKRDCRRAVLAQLDGEVVYEDIFPDVNLNCAVQALRFKDSFTFKTPESVRKLSFLLFTPEMQAEKQADDSIQVTASERNFCCRGRSCNLPKRRTKSAACRWTWRRRLSRLHGA